MKNKISIYALLLLLTACDFPEHFFTNPPTCVQEQELAHFDNSAADNYQKIVFKKLQDKTSNEYRYFFKTFLEEQQQIYMLTNFRNNNSCFDVKVRVEKLGKLAGMYRHNGRSYPNELYDLKWKRSVRQGNNEIVYVDMHDIID